MELIRVVSGGFSMKKQNVFIVLAVVIFITVAVVLYSLFLGNQYLITFDSVGTPVESELIKVGNLVEEPVEPVKEGYNFLYWQKDGEKYDFNSKVKGRFELVAKWEKKVSVSDLTYTVTFQSNGGSPVEEEFIMAGEKAIEPVYPVKEGYVFLGWYIGDEVFDFTKGISKDISLEARWKKEDDSSKENPEELKVGDRVKIIGEYASSATATSSFHQKAIGWKRIILEIYEGEEYPYRVGNKKGTTGYFKRESLEKISS